jgi:AraC-like DNA-binding protein
MNNDNKRDTTTIHIKNMLSGCCVKVIRDEFEKNNIEIENIRLGEATISFDKSEINLEKIGSILKVLGFELVVSREQKIISKIKSTVIELIHHLNNVDSIVRKSDYLVEMLGMSYQQLSKIFSKHEPVTLERYIILNKIERIKELLMYDEYTLSEIAYMMDYSSVQYLSNQFKKETSYSVSDYKKSGLNLKISLEDLS